MINHKKIIFLTCRYSAYPWYFLHSCRHNPDIDFLIFTNNTGENFDLPINVKIIPYSIEKFKKDAAKALGFEVAVESGYKLCDFKPAYGFIFSDYIKNMIFGAIAMWILFSAISAHL